MSIINLKRGSLAAIALAASAFLAPVQAAPVISVNLSTSNIQQGGVLGVDINVSGLTEALGGFEFTLNFNGALMSFSSLLSDPDTKMGDGSNPAFHFGTGPSGSSVNFGVLAGFVLPADEATLAGIQGPGFTMGRVELNANNLGTASFSISGFSLSDYDGATIADVTARGAEVCISLDGQTPCGTAVPEPTSVLLAAIALGGLALTRRRQKTA
ncbi:MAG: PEP-CTERM sorting domain-containing protein [Rubrivivax sp.]|nr:PEP-CTERM sorting domain-containing protein [Rubrivivax sp.]